jgi:hypothetical protein
MPKRVLVPSLKVKRLIRLFDSSPSSRMTKTKAKRLAPAAATKPAAALAYMAEELERDETAANSELGATAAPAANRSRSRLDVMATAVGEVFIPGAKKLSSGLQASGQKPRRHSDGGDAVAAGN